MFSGCPSVRCIYDRKTLAVNNGITFVIKYAENIMLVAPTA